MASKRTASSQRQQVAATFERLKALRAGVVLKGKLKDIIADGRD